MENKNVGIKITAEYKDGRVYYELYTSEHMDVKTVLSILTGGINLTIRGIDGPEKQGKALNHVIEFMKEEFVNTDSFNDINVNENGKINF